MDIMLFIVYVVLEVVVWFAENTEAVSLALHLTAPYDFFVCTLPLCNSHYVHILLCTPVLLKNSNTKKVCLCCFF